MKAIINGFKTLIKMIKMLFDIIMSIFESLGIAIKYLITIVAIAFEAIATLPPWLMAFAVITISLSIAYFLIGRNGGKSD